eukprot:CAMPEP_0202898908 /NCGR_PEP_ID=MMETSP1392-20130828/7304_1 /ASSEMBLY_ACC=CAM_ASM_000868 /TAXON_ID=225041 /ORGANISM="Chlamydomonas chlamydogama, Strain SAG 11-48b" /LENGTH=379 /DNA_ID=CAMNT_0049584973 /DNA_START=34 /DNA_END=1173 /DNA_ORIENTATION=+
MSTTEHDLKSLLANKDAESARLRAEINRLRHAISQSEKLHSSQADEVKSLQDQLAQVQLVNKAHERHAVLSAATASADSPPRAELHMLRAELDASKANVARLEAELSSQQAAAASRLSQLQDSFSTKIAEMRAAHQQQLAELQKAGAGSQSAQQADLARLRDQVSTLQGHNASLQQQLEQQQQQAVEAAARLKQQEHAGEQLGAKVRELEATKRKLEQQLKQQQQQQQGAASPGSGPGSSTTSAAGGSGASGSGQPPPDPGQGSSGGDTAGMAGMIELMETQLARLSEVIRTKESEVVGLRGAVTAGFEERRALQQQVDRLQQQLVQAASAATSPKGGASSAASDAGSVVPISPGRNALKPPSLTKPYRTGLVSKPKFR